MYINAYSKYLIASWHFAIFGHTLKFFKANIEQNTQVSLIDQFSI